MVQRKSSRLSVFADTLGTETAKLSLEAMGAYTRLLLAAHGEGGILKEAEIAAITLRTHTNKWRKLKVELVEKGFVVQLENNSIAIKHFINDGETRGVCPQVIDEQVLTAKSINTPPVTTGVTPRVFVNTPIVTPQVTPGVTPPVLSGKPAENLDPFFPTISIPYTILDNSQCSNTNSTRDESLEGDRKIREHGKIFKAIVEAEPNLQIASTALIYNWLQNGCSPELDIIPTVQRMIKKAGPGNVKSLKYFDAAIQQSKVDRQSAPLNLAPGNAKSAVPSPYVDDRNIDYVGSWKGFVVGGSNVTN